MEIVLSQNQENQIMVICDDKPSHTFSLIGLLPQQTGGVLTDPIETSKGLFAALFGMHVSKNERIPLVAEDAALDAIPWEYLYGPNGFISNICHD